MPCYHPLLAFRTAAGGVVMSGEGLSRNAVERSFAVPCGQCIGCRLERSRQWAVRCVHEAQMHERNCFITLTYDNSHLPHRGQLVYGDFQRFMKRLRKTGSARFFMCGEYGDENRRPHYHACLFGYDFSDKQYFKKSGATSGDNLYQSDALSRLWPYGLHSIGNVSFESAAYCARYVCGKVTGQAAEAHYARSDAAGPFQLVPEFCHMSLKPGIGASWYAKFRSDVFPHDRIVSRGTECNVPRYYDKLFKRQEPVLMDELKAQRELTSYRVRDDNTDARLAVKEAVARARSSLLIRSEI